MQHIYKFLIALLAIIGGVYFWISSSNEFEVPAPGLYVGSLEGLFPHSVSMLVSRRNETSPIQVIIAKKGFDPLTIQPIEIHGPLKFSSDEGKIEITSSFNTHEMRGKAYIEGSNSGSFVLTLQPNNTQPLDGVLIADTKIWLTSNKELETVESFITTGRQRVMNASREIERLGGFLNDGDLLRGNAQRRLQQERLSLEKVKSEVENKQQEAKRLSRQVELAYRVTGMGRLVSLARETFEREGRIIDTLLRSGGKQEISPQVIEASKKAERALELKRIIEAENNKIYELLHPEEVEPLPVQREVETSDVETPEVEVPDVEEPDVEEEAQ